MRFQARPRGGSLVTSPHHKTSPPLEHAMPGFEPSTLQSAGSTLSDLGQEVGGVRYSFTGECSFTGSAGLLTAAIRDNIHISDIDTAHLAQIYKCY